MKRPEQEPSDAYLSTRPLDKLDIDSNPPTLPQRLSNGDLLAGRFRIIRYIASGGMGDVYEAEDEELRERVAVKTIRPAILIQPNAVARFRREVHLARQVTHPNVCRIFDMFRHKPGDRPDQEIVFISMELLHGAHLGNWLKNSGQMSAEESLPLIRQMGSALAAAHRAGIVHRDFKPQNVVLVSVPGQDEKRAVVTDFGLALQWAISAEGPSLSTEQGLLGTPAYMSPEQIEGRPATASSDIYALGLVIYEMVTGSRPFQGDTPMSEAIKRLSQAPVPPRKFEPGLSSVWERVILRCLERDPRMRFANPDDVAQALAGEGSLISPRKRHLRPRTMAGIAAALFIAAMLITFLHHHANVHRLRGTDTIVVADFNNKSGDDIFNDALKQALVVELEQSSFLNILPAPKVNEELHYMGRSPETGLSADIAREVCLRAGSKAILSGSIWAIGKQYALGLKAENCRDGTSLAEEQVVANDREQVLGKLHQAGKSLRNKLGESLSSIEGSDVPLQQATTPSLEALQSYSRATRAWQVGDESGSVTLYRHALELDPDFAAAYADLAVIYADFNQFGLAAENAGKAYERRSRATERERFIIDSTYYLYATGEQDKAANVYELWKKLFPRDLTPYVQAGIIDSNLGKLSDALQNDQEARTLVPNSPNAIRNLAFDYIYVGRLDDARALLREAASHRIDDPFLQNYYQLAFLQNDAKEMRRCVAAAMGRSGDEDSLLASQSDTEAFAGRLKQALVLSRQAITSALNSGGKETAAGWEVTAALREAEFGNVAEAMRLASGALAIASTRDLHVSAALAFARAGDIAKAKAEIAQLEKVYPNNTLLHSYWLPTIRAAIALQKNSPFKALEVLEGTQRYELGGSPPSFSSGATLYSAYIRGQAYLVTRQWSAAVIEFQKFSQHRGLIWNFPLGPLSSLQLARTHAAMGDPAARSEYENVIALWQDGDPDLALLRQAKVEYSRLK